MVSVKWQGLGGLGMCAPAGSPNGRLRPATLADDERGYYPDWYPRRSQTHTRRLRADEIRNVQRMGPTHPKRRYGVYSSWWG